MLQVVLEPVGLEFSLYTVSRTAHTGTVRASALYHKSWDYTVECKPVIKTFSYKLFKIFACLGCYIGIELYLNFFAVF